MFVVETDEDSARESLFRVSGGQIDTGFAMGDSVYQSSNHRRTDPLDAGPSDY